MYYHQYDLKAYREHCQMEDSIQVNAHDSTMITLRNGLSWNLEKVPPEEPEDFLRLLIDEEERNRPEVQDRLKYLAFVTRCDEQDQLAVNMIEFVQMYYSLYDPDDRLCLKVVYRLQPNKEGRFEIKERKVIAY